MSDESNFDNDVSKRSFDHCGKCGKALGRHYVTGNKRERYRDQDGKTKRRMAAIKTMYCNEQCCEDANATLSDTFSF